jgi:[acyl-carrier-protein] S-malonyltransferase
MRSAAVEYSAAIDQLELDLKPPILDFYSNISGGKLENFNNIKEYLAKHIVSPVYFKNELNAMYKDGIDTFIELGPGKTLTSFVKRTIKDAKAVNIENLETLEKALKFIAN